VDRVEPGCGLRPYPGYNNKKAGHCPAFSLHGCVYQPARAAATIPAALAALASTLSHSPALSQAFGTIHEPPTQTTFGWARYSAAVSSVMPPAGQISSSPIGPARPLSMAKPPTALAGNSLHTRKPRAISDRNSVGVAPPGTAGIGALASASASSGGVPGVTRKSAP